MPKKKSTKKKTVPEGGAGGGEGDMPSGGMDQPFKEGLMEMPSGEMMFSTEGPSDMPQGGMAGPQSTGGGLMPGESPNRNSGMQQHDMPGGDMTST